MPKEYYCSVTTRTPFAAVLVRRHFTGTLIVGGSWQSERSFQAVLDELKARLKKEFGQYWLKAGIVALIEDSEAGRALAELAENTIPLGWTNVYQPMEALRQDLETVIRVQAVTAKLQIDEDSPGAHQLAQVLDARIEGGMYDALALSIHEAKENENFTDDIKIIGSWPPE
jgi:hypothetical protein